jgi:hypothetical protein
MENEATDRADSLAGTIHDSCPERNEHVRLPLAAAVPHRNRSGGAVQSPVDESTFDNFTLLLFISLTLDGLEKRELSHAH